MKIGIVSDFGHMECLGFILEIYKNNKIDIDVYIGKDTDNRNWIKYYLTMFNFNVIRGKFHDIIINDYDKIFKLTSNDKCLDDERIISILHKNSKQQLRCKSKKYISLTPYINGVNIYYTFPIYYPILSDNSENSKSITMIGYYNDDNIDKDLLTFININDNYKFNFIICGGNGNKLRNIKNVNYYSKVETNSMIDILNSSKYILSKKHINYDRFSGQLSLAMSHEIPLIVDIKTKNSYNLPGITFDKNYCDIENLDNISDEKYSELKNEIKLFKYNNLENNKKIFDSEF
jgi:hypothetical protein